MWYTRGVNKAKRSYLQRAQFPVRRQREFIKVVQSKLHIDSFKLAQIAGVAPRTLRDWKQEKFHMSLVAVRQLCRAANIPQPIVKIKEPFWYTAKGAMRAWQVISKKYGRVPIDPEYRMQKWREWWEREGKFQHHPIINVAKSFMKPRKSKELAEFIGIMMGDGGMTKWQMKITLNRFDDHAYSQYVGRLITKLFGVKPSVSLRSSTVDLIISRVRLVDYCVLLGLKIGNKIHQRFDIPGWIKRQPSFAAVCVRGLMDTDGCIFNECHHINGKRYCYPRLTFVSHSEPLRRSVFCILWDVGFTPKLRNNRSVNLERRKDIIDYFTKIGTNNPKHSLRYRSFIGEVG